TQLEGYRGHTLVGDPAGQDVCKEAEVGRHVERKAMGGDALRDLDADGRDLAVADPDAGVTGKPVGRNPEVGEDVDQAAFELAQVEADIGFGAEIEDRIADQLPRAVVSHVPAAIDLEAGDAARRKLRFIQKNVIAGATATDRVRMRMLEQDEGVGYETSACL